MVFEMKDMTGSLFVNDRKQRDSHPDFSGKLMVAGTTYRLSAWKRQTKDGKSYLSLAIREAPIGNTSEDRKADPFDL